MRRCGTKPSKCSGASFRGAVAARTIRGLLSSGVRLIRDLPPAYRFGPLVLILTIGLAAASLAVIVETVDIVVVTGEAPPGTASREIPLNETPFFRATLAVGSCGVAFHLLTDADFAAFLADGRLPPATLNCSRTQALVRSPVGHMVTVYNVNPGTANLSYSIAVEFFAERHPYALLSIPSAFLGLGSTIWIATTMFRRGTEKLAAEYTGLPERFRKRK